MSKIFIAFFAGLAVSFSPCVFPLIPVTLGIIGAKSGCSRGKAVVISLVYVLGIAITYSLFGVLAAVSGRILGSLVNHNILYFIAGNICLLMGLSVFGVFNLRLPVLFSRGLPARKENGHNRKDLLQVLCLGLFSGLIIGPCVGPVLAGILALVGVEGRILAGALLLFVFAWGMGVSLVMAGAFSGLVNRMFSSFRLEWVKKIWGGILIFAAEYFFIKMGGV